MRTEFSFSRIAGTALVPGRALKVSLTRAIFLTVCLLWPMSMVLSACQTSETLSSARQEASGRAAINSPIKPFKDNLFSYRTPLEARDGGAYLRVPYNELTDINGRDEVPVRKAKSQYIKRLPSSVIGTIEWTSEGRNLTALAAGKFNGGARFTVIYLHGRDGTAEWGFDDERFGGNFNRAKNLMVENGGAWVSANFTNFEIEGTADISVLIDRLHSAGSGRIILACGSLGTKVCWSIASNEKSRRQISGLVVLGGFPDSGFLRVAYSGVFDPLPVYIAHGSDDPVYDVAAMEDFHNALNAKNQPSRMTVFETGNHGTPVRMIDWRQALNWLLTR